MSNFQSVLSDASTVVLLQLLLALFLGMLIGTERAYAGKTAGMRTHALVSMGSCLFVSIASVVSASYADAGFSNFDPLRLAAAVVMGIGFLGAGEIFFKDSKLSGLTTAAGLWVAAAIGMAAGYGLYSIAVFATILTLFTFTVLWLFEEKFVRRHRRNGDV